MNTRILKSILAAAVLAGPAAAIAQDSRAGDTARAYPLDRVVAIVGKKAITLYQLNEAVNEENQSRVERNLPPFSGDTLVLMRRVLDGLIDAELLKQKGEEFKIVVPEAEVSAAADERLRNARGQFRAEQEFRDALTQAGFSTPEALRAHFVKQEHDQRLQRLTIDTLTKLGFMPTISVSERDVEQAFDSIKTTLRARGPTVTFRQLVVKPTWSDSADARARATADSLLLAIRGGASWDSLARRFSADSMGDSSSARRGGDLGWIRRGVTTEAFDSTAFRLPLNELSPVFKTEFGYHFLRVDRARPGEVRVRHILITPEMTKEDVERAKAKVAQLAEALKAGANYDSIADLHHDTYQHRRKAENYPISDLPPEYVEALREVKAGDFSPIFEVVPPEGGMNKAAIMQIISRNDSGEYTLAEARQSLRNQLQTAGSWRRLLDMLRTQTYISIRLDSATPAAQIRQ